MSLAGWPRFSACFCFLLHREEMTEVGIIEDVDPVNPLVALPLSSCPLKCSSQGGCVRRKDEVLPFCTCRYGFQGMLTS